MSLKIIHVKGWAHILRLFDEMENEPPLKVARLYRGQADHKWKLDDSFSRLIPSDMDTETALGIEEAATRSFVARARIYMQSSIIPDNSSLIDWWAIMQHFGVPTRLMDWTASPYVALYFAVTEEWKKPGAVWTIDYRERIEDELELTRAFIENSQKQTDFFWRNSNNKDFCFFVDLGALDARIANQHGFLSFCGRIPSDHGSILERTDEGRRDLRKLVIKPSLKPLFLDRLRKMNISPHLLFPGLDGLGKSIKDAIRLEAKHWLSKSRAGIDSMARTCDNSHNEQRKS
jgi:hypothetical protein